MLPTNDPINAADPISPKASPDSFHNAENTGRVKEISSISIDTKVQASQVIKTTFRQNAVIPPLLNISSTL